MKAQVGWAFIVLAGAAVACRAVASTGAEFLRFIPSARSVGMGETSAAVGSGVGALSGNPAGLLGSPGSVVGLSHGTEIGGQRQEAATFVTGGARTAAGGQLVMSAMSFDAVDGVGDAVRVDAQELVASLGAARRFGSWLRVGATARAWTSAMLDRRATGLCMDIGMRAVRADRFALGLVISHLGGGESFGGDSSALPTRIRAGAAARHLVGALAVAATGEWIAPVGGGEFGGLHAGTEVSWQRFALRCGYAGTAGLGPWSAGGSAGVGPLTLHYAMATRGGFSPAHRISAEWQWGGGMI